MIINNQTYGDVWQSCLSRIREHTSDEEFAKWFKPIVPLDFDGVTLKLKVPNESYVYHIEKHFIPLLKPIIHQLFGLKTKLRYAVPKTEPAAVTVVGDADMTAINKFVAQSDTTNIKNPFVIPGIRRLVIDPQLNPNYTFDTFVEGACNRLCRSAGLAVAVDPGRTPFNPLYIYGDSGLGKTHIAQAIGMEVKQRKPQLQVLYVSMNKFQAQFQNAAIKGELNDFIHFYQMLDVLIIDDIQELAGKDKTQNAFFNIFNHLHLSNKQLVMTSDKPPVELKDIEQRLLTRFKWGLSAQLNTPDYDTKLKIQRAKGGVEVGAFDAVAVAGFRDEGEDRTGQGPEAGGRGASGGNRVLGGEYQCQCAGNRRRAVVAGGERLVSRQEDYDHVGQGDSEGVCAVQPARDYDRSY